MRIGIDCRPLQEIHPSGVSVYTADLLHALFALPESTQHDFVFFLNGFKLHTQSELLHSLREQFPQKNITWSVHRWPNKLLTATEVAFSSPSLHWMYGGTCDLVFVPNMKVFPLRDTSIPFVLTVHDLSFERYPECLSVKRRWRHRLLHPRAFVQKAAQLVTVSTHTASDLEQLYGVSAEKMHTIYPGLVQPTLSQLPRTVTNKTILSLATIEPRKNIETLLDAFALLHAEDPETTLIIAGGPGWKSRDLIQRMQTMEGVTYMGYVSQKEKVQLFAEAAIFVYPSLYEGFGFPPLEAQQHSIPVIAGGHSSLPEVLGNSALYADVLDTQSVFRAMKHLLDDAPLRAEYIRRGQDNVQRFHWKQAAQATLSLLVDVGQSNNDAQY